jgi:pyrroline-5-carboxylate reductase
VVSRVIGSQVCEAGASCPTSEPLDLPTRSGSSGIVRSAGTAIAAEEEDRFDGLCVISPMATSFAFASAPAECLARHGVHPRQARNYVAHIYMGLGRTTVEAPSRSFAELAADRTTLRRHE